MDAIFEWCHAQSVSFERASAMVALWNDDPEYWSSRGMWRLHDATAEDVCHV